MAGSNEGLPGGSTAERDDASTPPLFADNSKTNRGSRFQTANVILISLAHLFHDIYSSFLAPLRPLLIEKLDLSLALAAALDIFQRLPALFNPVIGLMADRISVRYFIIISPAITAIGMSLLGISTSYIMLIILLFITGMSSALFHVPSPVMIRKISGNHTGKGMSYYMMGGEIARTLGPLVITGAISLWTLEGTYRLIPFGLAASVVLYFRFRKIKISDELVERSKKKKNKTGFPKQLFYFFFIIALFTFFRSVLKSGLTGFLPTFLFHDKGETLWASNLALAILQLSGVLGTFLSGTISDKIGRKLTLLIASIATPIVMLLFIHSSGFLQISALFILGIFLFAPTPVILAMIQDIGSTTPSLLNGIYMTISFGIGSLAILLIGFTGDMIGLENGYKLFAWISFLAVPCVLLIPSGKTT